MARRFYDPQPFVVGASTLLGENAANHIARVLRMRSGDEVVLFNGQGGEYPARLVTVGRREVVAEPTGFLSDDRCPISEVTLALPLIKGDRMDYAIQKGTELGAAAFHLVECERSDVRLDEERREKKIEHYRQVAISACEQCGMNRIPVIAGITPLKEYLERERAALKLVGHPGLPPLQHADLVMSRKLALLTGPEGGFSDEEIQAARDAGFIGFALGERVLRAETAPVALLAALWAQISLL